MVWERCSGSPPSFPSFLSSSAGPSQRATTVYQICDLCSIFIAKVFNIFMKIWRFFTKICSHLLDKQCRANKVKKSKQVQGYVNFFLLEFTTKKVHKSRKKSSNHRNVNKVILLLASQEMSSKMSR